MPRNFGMPNHVHFIWEQFDKEEIKETSNGSFMKFNGHCFKKMLRQSNPDELKKYASEMIDRSFNFWQRDALPVILYSRQTAVGIPMRELKPTTERNGLENSNKNKKANF